MMIGRVATATLSVLMIVLSGCGGDLRQGSSSVLYNVFDEDDRVPLSGALRQWTGRVVTSQGVCTGSLIGPRHVLTNAHCVVHRDLTPQDNIVFQLGWQNSRSLAMGTPIEATVGSNVGADDWAVMVLRENLGDEFGWLEMVDVDSAASLSFPRRVTNVGYSGDFQNGQVAGVHVNCKIHGIEADMLLHDCDTTRGASGGPLLVTARGHRPVILGINSAEKRVPGNEPLVGIAWHPNAANLAVPAWRINL
jgi:V8-like Glu-specific endopeptidase